MALDGWRNAKLGALIDVKHGFAFQGEFFNDEPPGDILLTPGNFAIGGGFKSDKLKYYVGPVPDDFVLQEGDILITMTDLSKNADTLGYPAIVPKPRGLRYLHNQRLGKVIIKDRAPLRKDFLYYLLRTREYRHEVVSSATGTTVKHTSPERVMAFEFQLPPLPEQRAIAHILGTLDDKIELNRRMNETLEAMARATFKSWFVDFLPVRANMARTQTGDPVRAKMEGRLPAPSDARQAGQPTGIDAETAALFPDSFEDSPLGKIPKGWRVGTIGDEFNLMMGQSPPGETYNEIGEGLPFFQGRTDFGFRFPTQRVYCTAPTRQANPGDTMVSVRAPVGDINMASETCCIGRGVAAIRHKSGSRSYTFYMMHSLRDTFADFEAEGTVFGCINKDDFQGIKCITPPAELIKKYEQTAFPLDEAIRNNDLSSHTLAATRDALLPKLLVGEIRVKDVQSFLEAFTEKA